MTAPLLVVASCWLHGESPAASPREDFLAWYSDWIDQLPSTYDQTFREYFHHRPDAPLEMLSSRWGDARHLLITTTNSDLRKTFRYLENPTYCALLDGIVGSNGDVVWSVSQFAGRHDGGYEPAALSGHEIGATPDFLALRRGLFDAPHRVAPSAPDPLRPSRSNVVITFTRRDPNRPRLPRQITVALDNEQHGLPVEVRTEEFGGAGTRMTISGWGRRGDSWTFSELRLFYQRAGAANEVLHHTQNWQFGANHASRENECWLAYYGLPEPGSVPWNWKLVAGACTVALVVSGRHLQKHGLRGHTSLR